MKRQTAIRLIRFLFIAQVVSLCVGLLKMVSAMRSGLHIYLLAYLVGLIVGSGLAILWFRQWKGLEAISEEQWNRALYISPPGPPNNPSKHRGIQFLGWLAAIGGCSIAILLVRVLIVGHIVNFWNFVGDVLLVALAVDLLSIGWRAIWFAKGQPRTKARFGWGRMLLGAWLLFSTANTQFHLVPTQTIVRPLEYSNPAQAASGNLTTIAICIGCVFLILWGIWKGFQPRLVRPPLR
jgi:hypothetical protein